MKCSECGTDEGSIEEYKLSFGIDSLENKLFKASYERFMCKACMLSNVMLLKNELEFMHESDDIPAEKGKLDIFVNDDLLKTT